MKYFSKAYFDFFQLLEANNNSTWFKAHKEIYDLTIEQPFERFIEDILSVTSEKNPKIEVKAKQAIFRINRDMRFARGMPPYKTFRSALISEDNKRSKTIPGFYIELGYDQIRLGGGIYQLKGNDIMKVKRLDSFEPDADFIKRYKSVVVGDKNSSITYEAILEPKLILDDTFMNTVMDYWQAGQLLNQFLS